MTVGPPAAVGLLARARPPGRAGGRRPRVALEFRVLDDPGLVRAGAGPLLYRPARPRSLAIGLHLGVDVDCRRKRLTTGAYMASAMVKWPNRNGPSCRSGCGSPCQIAVTRSMSGVRRS